MSDQEAEERDRQLREAVERMNASPFLREIGNAQLPPAEWFAEYDLLPDRDFREALSALQAMVEAAFEALARQDRRIEALDPAIRSADSIEAESAAIDAQIGEMQHHVFLEAAVTHGCVGGLASLFEGLFKTLFRHTGKKKRKHQGFVDWVYEVLENYKVANVLASEQPVLRALFMFRNAALHNGYEWPAEERSEFLAAVKLNGWEQWFEWSTSGGDPWVISPTRAFLEACLKAGWEILGPRLKQLHGRVPHRPTPTDGPLEAPP